jgi:hypothetical protein
MTALVFYLNAAQRPAELATERSSQPATAAGPEAMQTEALATEPEAPQRPREPLAAALQADTPEPDDSTVLTEISAQLEEALALLKAQEEALTTQTAKLDAQSATLESYSQRVTQLETSLDELRNSTTLVDTGISTISTNPSSSTPDTTVDISDDTELTEGQALANANDATRVSTTADTLADTEKDAVEKEQQDDPTRVLLNSLPGAMRLPGTNTVMKWGGYVKSAVVKSFDPLASDDRFITGAIPVTVTEGIEEQTTLSVQQSRLNLDMREPTRVGLLRAFVEGDFAGGDGETFRLRHAFGQRGNVLAGKTWSGFVDRSSSPEEVDFEGLNGRINVRQAQFRFQPGFGRKYEMAVSIEDPSPEVTNGKGVSQVPDLVVSGRVNLRNNFHTRLAVLLRQVRAQPDSNPDDVAKEFGYALQLSSSVDVPLFNDRDKIMFQVNVGKGYGRYVNDLNSVGDFDGVFDANGELELIDVLAGYVSAQHWWRNNLRSNFTIGYVELDNPSFVDDSFYKSTKRVSGNLFWTPTPRFDLGAELLWGEKETEGGDSGTASQFQFAARYLF